MFRNKKSQSNSYYAFQRPEMREFLPEQYSHVLEVGCGEGGFKNNLRGEFEYWGIELNQQAAETATAELDKVLHGSYHDCSTDLPNDYFDLIICNDVIEHIDDYQWVLNDLKNKLKDSGHIVISIPNIRYLPVFCELIFKRDFRYREAGVLDKTHLRFFTFKSIRRSLTELGWDIEALQGINKYGKRKFGPKRLLAHLARLLLGFDTIYAQIAIRAKKDYTNH